MEKICYPKEIQVFFNEIVTKIQKILDPELILIAGSFGKESWLFSCNELISDFEFVFVCKNNWSLKKKKKLLKSLNEEYPYEIGLKGYLLDKINKKIISNYSYHSSGYVNLDFFDTFSNPVYLYTKNDKKLKIKFLPDEIPVWEAWRLIINRIGDIISAEYAQIKDEQLYNYQWLKIFESFADAYCIVNKTYNNKISKRIEVFDKETIQNDKELNASCKKSFTTIQQALKSRKEHDLSAFKNSFSSGENKKIVLSWLKYFEKKLSLQEKLVVDNEQQFYKKYLSNKMLQNKYLENNLIVSNTIRLIYNPGKLWFPFKFYNYKYSWRHLVLLCVSSIFKEHCSNEENFPISNKIAKKLINKKRIERLNEKDFVLEILDYWKILR